MMTLSRADQACDGARRLARKIPSGVREAGGVALSVYVAVPTSEGMAWMEIDCGNGGANVIGKHLAPLFKLDPGKKEPQPASFMIAGGIPVEGPTRVNETLTMDGNIGVRFLINWDLTLDLAKGRAWLAPAKPLTSPNKEKPNATKPAAFRVYDLDLSGRAQRSYEPDPIFQTTK
jgi:hypothetical protein